MWSFYIPEDTQRGYKNPSSAGYPAYNIFPGDRQFGRRLGGRDTVQVFVTGSEIPRVLDLQYATQPYPSSTDSVRTLWTKDTVLALSGPGSVDSLVFPEVSPAGRPILFAGETGALTSGLVGSEGARTWSNTLSTAKRFLPAFAGQNTPRRSPSRVTGLSADSVIEFSEVNLAGRTAWWSSGETPTGKRLRVLNKGGAPFRVGDSTTALVAGTMALGLSKAGAETPIRSDSLAWWTSGQGPGQVVDSLSAYWYKGPAQKQFSAVLVERLGLGRGRDTVALPQGHRLFSVSAEGFHLDVDTAFKPSSADFPRLGLFSIGVAGAWPGRQAGDSVLLELRKTHPRQKAFIRDGGSYTPVAALKEDSMSILVAMPIDKAGRAYFLAHEYAIATGLNPIVAVGKDTLLGLKALRPGDLSLDTGFQVQGLALDSMRVLLKRKFILDNLQLEGAFTLKAQGKVPQHQTQPKAFALRAGRWDSIAVSYASGEYRFALLAGDSAVLALERIPAPQDTSLPKPAAGPFVETRDGTLLLKPVLTPSELAKTKAYRVEITSLDAQGNVSHKVLENLAPDSTLRILLAAGTLYEVKIGYESHAGRIYWANQVIPAGNRDAFRQALNERAPTYAGRVRELVGVPTDVDLKALVAGLSAEEAAAVEVDEWKGEWVSLGQSSRLRKGKGYLLALPKSLRPVAAQDLVVRMGADTVHLDTGWNLIANPLPYPFADAAVLLDSSLVSAAYALAWNGVGKSATYEWRRADTLKPFTGYAIHATRKTSLIFNPRAPSLPKKGHVSDPMGPLVLAFYEGAEKRADLELQAGTLQRPSPIPPSMGPRTWATWQGGRQYLNHAVPTLARFEEPFEVHSPTAQSLTLRLSRASVGEESVLALWDAQKNVLVRVEGSVNIDLAVGANPFTLLALPAAELDAKEAALKARNPLQLRLSAPAPNPARHFARLALALPMGQGRRVLLAVTSVTGRLQYRHEIRELSPGHHTLDLPISSWTPGTYVCRVEASGPRGRAAATVKLLVLEGAP